MIVFVTTRSHAYTVKALIDGTFGTALPEVRAMAWEDIFYARRLPRATYIFTDIERLSASELALAAHLYRCARAAGLRCLNDPARIKQRHALLHALHAAGFNPFNAYRAETSPRPVRFPVFIRGEADHGLPVTELLPDQPALEAALAALQDSGVSLHFMLVIEFCAEPIAPGAWRKHGTFRIGPAMHFDHSVIEDRWLVKYGTHGLATMEMQIKERDDTAANAGAEALRPIFEIAQIEFGRADHTSVGGREVVYEINTNPMIYPLTKQRLAVRDQAQAMARARFAGLLVAVDTAAGGMVDIVPTLPESWRRSWLPVARRLGLAAEEGRRV